MESKRARQKRSNLEFIDRTEKAFIKWVQKTGKPKDTKSMIEYFVRHNFIRETIINRWMVLEVYAEELAKTKCPKYPRGVKQRAIWATEERVALGETQIKQTIGHHSYFFRRNKFQFP